MKYQYLTALLIIFLFNACAALPKPDIDSSGEFTYKGVPSRPGAAVWSNDSAQLAVIRGSSMIIIDTISGSSKVIKGTTPLYLEWSPGDDLLVISKNGANNELIRISHMDGSHNAITLKHSPVSARWYIPPDDILILSLNENIMKIGTFATYRFSLVSDNIVNDFFKGEVYYPTLSRDIDITTGWIYPEIRPLYETVITPMFHSPPVIAPYTNFRTVDPVTGIERDINKFNSRRFSVPSSWSPDGSRLAVTNDEGLLTILDVNNPIDSGPINHDITGLVPAWNPAGSQIYLGGWLVHSDGQALTQILADAFHSLGFWSPDGKKLAIITKDDMMHIKNISPFFIPPDRPFDSSLSRARDKFRILKDLYKNGLLMLNEFNERKIKILDDVERDSL
jgi:WD40 repeat protein